MKLRQTFLLLLGLLALVACSEPEGDLKGSGNQQAGTRERPLPALLPADSAALGRVTPAELNSDPAAFLGKTVEIEGLFQADLGEICSDRRFGAPVSWALQDGSDTINAAGLENLARALPDGQITLVVEGTWRSWTLPADCRQEGGRDELYYLEALRVISPNPIALAPGEDGSPRLLISPVSGAVQGTVIPTATGLVATPPSTLGPIETPSTPFAGGPSATTTTGGNGSGYPGSQATATAGIGGYPAPAQPTLVPQPTADMGGTAPVVRGRLEPASLETGVLTQDITEAWTPSIAGSELITIQVTPERDLSLSVTIMDQDQQVYAAVVSVNPGQVINVAAVSLPNAGEYSIVLSALYGSQGSYAILLSVQDTYNFEFLGNMENRVSYNGSLATANDDFWFFSGNAGDIVDITARPVGGADLFMRLFDVHGVAIITFRDENPAAVEEQITAFTLPETGLYSVLVGEVDFSGGDYVVTLERR